MKLSTARVIFALGALASAFANVASADVTMTEGESKLRVEEFQDKNAVAGDIDTEITNAKLRAESGSKSRFSLSTAMQYRGGSINRAFAAERPALSADPGTQSSTSLSLEPQFRYRWSKNDSVTLGNGFGVMTPLQGSSNFDSNGRRVKQFNVFDPMVDYNRAGTMGAFQTNGAIGTSVSTSNETRGLDNTFTPNAQYTLLHVFQNGLTLGSSFAASYALYSSKPGANVSQQTDSYGGDKRNTFTGAIYPFLEYAFNDRYSLRTLFGYFNFVHRYGDPNNFRLLQDFVYQSVGVGISVTRDIYLYPNLQFSPNEKNQLAHDRTNVALNATLNVF